MINPYQLIDGRWFVEKHGLLVPMKRYGESPAVRLGYDSCPTCGGRKTKRSNARASGGPIKCADAFHDGELE